VDHFVLFVFLKDALLCTDTVKERLKQSGKKDELHEENRMISSFHIQKFFFEFLKKTSEKIDVKDK
jgi:hypothetical protein